MSLAGVSAKKQLELVQEFGSTDKVWASFCCPQNLKQILSDKETEKITQVYNSNSIKDFETGLENLGIDYITIESEKYPKQLKEIFDPPTVLYCKGDISLFNKDALAIVGTRVCSRYGVEQTKIFSKALSKAGFVIVSGLAEGIDGIAQQECINNGGKTIAVLAGGLNHIYPSINQNLAKEIVKKGGLLISENPPSYMPKGYNFVQRNRIIAGLSLGVFVPEASEKSGSLHTVNFANDNGRYIFALPGQVNSSKSAGTNRLIKNLQGCCVLEPNDIISQFPQFKKQQKEKSKAVQLDINEQLILGAVQEEEVHFDEILRKTQLDTKTLNSLLTRMEIRGLIIRLGGNYFTTKH